MAFKAAVTKEEYDALPEELKQHYAENNGQFNLAVTAAMGLDLINADGLKSSLQKERASVKSLITKLESFDDLDPEAARAALKTVDELGDQASVDEKIAAGLKAKEEQLQAKFQKDLDAQTAKFSTDLTAANKRADTLERQLENELVTSAATAAISKAKGSVRLLLPVVRGMVRMEKRDDGTMAAAIMDGSGNPRLSTQAGSMDPMTMDELVEELRGDNEFARGFDGSGASGGGSSNSDGGGTGGAHTISNEKAKDPAAYRAAKAAADKAGVELQLTE